MKTLITFLSVLISLNLWANFDKKKADLLHKMKSVTDDIELKGTQGGRKELSGLDILSHILTDNGRLQWFDLPYHGTEYYITCTGAGVQLALGATYAKCALWSMDPEGLVEYYPGTLYKVMLGFGAGFSVQGYATVKVQNIDSLDKLSGFSISLHSGMIAGGITWATLTDKLGVTYLDGETIAGLFANLISVSPYLIFRTKHSVKNSFQLNEKTINFLK